MDVRPSALAGRWYPAQPERLRGELQTYLGAGSPSAYGHIYGLWVPHAGLRYSGPVAGCAFRHLTGRYYDVVVVVAPSHYPYPYALLTCGHEAYQTPLGVVAVDTELIRALGEFLPLALVRDDPEHAIEIEIPFLQLVLGQFRLLPLAMVDQSAAAAWALAEALGQVLAGQRVLYVASSDLSHFYDHQTACRLDQVILDAVAAYDPAEVIAADEQGRGFACGRAALAAVMRVCADAGARVAHIERHATSGDTSGDYSRVVGYGAATFTA